MGDILSQHISDTLLWMREKVYRDIFVFVRCVVLCMWGGWVGIASSLKLRFTWYTIILWVSQLSAKLFMYICWFNTSVKYMISPILQMREARHREVKWLFHGNPATKNERWYWNPDLSVPTPSPYFCTTQLPAILNNFTRRWQFGQWTLLTKPMRPEGKAAN